MTQKIILAAILILSGIQTYSQDTIKGRITGYEGNYTRPAFPGATIIIEPMPGVTILEKWNDFKNFAISDRDGTFKIKVEGDKRNLELSFIGFYRIKIINIPKEDKTIDIQQIKMVNYHLDDNMVVGGPPSDLYSIEELKEKDKILRMNVLEKYRIDILGKKLKPYFEGKYLVFDFDKNENE